MLPLVCTGGPLVGASFYAVLLIYSGRTRQPDYQPATAAGIVGLAVHVVATATAGRSAHPALAALNLSLRAALTLVAWLAGRQAQQDDLNEQSEGYLCER